MSLILHQWNSFTSYKQIDYKRRQAESNTLLHPNYKHRNASCHPTNMQGPSRFCFYVKKVLTEKGTTGKQLHHSMWSIRQCTLHAPRITTIIEICRSEVQMPLFCKFKNERNLYLPTAKQGGQALQIGKLHQG